MIFYEPIIQPLVLTTGHNLDVLRLDLVHPEISGNKWFKLKYNLEKALAQNTGTIITFGGHYSNHIAATAAACKLYNLRSVAVIRGEEQLPLNPTLSKAKENGMQLHYVSRQFYSQKNNDEIKNYLDQNFGDHYLIPEGGNNTEGVLGCMDILKKEWDHDRVFCACGTAATFTGLVASAKPGQNITGISVLKGENKLPGDAEKMLKTVLHKDIKISGNDILQKPFINEHCIINAYSFSGYAKFDGPLNDFKNNFETTHRLPLDHIYTNKLFYAVSDLLRSKKINENSKILVIHSGGLQGNKGFEDRYHLTPIL